MEAFDEFGGGFLTMAETTFFMDTHFSKCLVGTIRNENRVVSKALVATRRRDDLSRAFTFKQSFLPVYDKGNNRSEARASVGLVL